MRDYTEKDCLRLEEVLFYRSADVSIERLKRYIDLFEKGDSTLEQRRTILANYIIHLEEEQKPVQGRAVPRQATERCESQLHYMQKQEAAPP